MTLFALLKLNFLKPLRGKNLAVRKISAFDFDHNVVILTMFPFNRYNLFLQSIFFSLSRQSFLLLLSITDLPFVKLCSEILHLFLAEKWSFCCCCRPNILNVQLSGYSFTVRYTSDQ